ncbi:MULTISPECIES: DUF167 family protein [Mesorhizobium]|uniref:DUF167 family protein n=1 Tax=Mesorhizobium sp. GR13 TaxID=2562308 RepID=UPI001FE1971E|nr:MULTISPECIES: DUF167 family protein [Mesorhizobium]
MHKDGVELTVRLTPRSSSNKVEGLIASADGAQHLSARVRAVPEKGKANTALEELVAEWLGVPKRTVSIVSGSTSRLKTVMVNGDPRDLSARIAALAQQTAA